MSDYKADHEDRDALEEACENWSARALLAEARFEEVRRCAQGLADVAMGFTIDHPVSMHTIAAQAWVDELRTVLGSEVAFARAQAATAFQLLTAAQSAIAAARAQLPGRRA